MNRLLKFGLLVALYITMGALVPAPASAAPVTRPVAAAYCECVDYVINHFYLDKWKGPSFYYAQDMGPYLRYHGFVPTNAPNSGDVVIFSARFMGNAAGHIGIVEQVRYTNNGRDIVLRVRGANQGGSQIENGCNNVNTLQFRAFSRYSSDVQFFHWPYVA